ncbi:vacuolar protein sorting-associated protein 41 homolog [Lineus longissimus]|uniref:vacuolar protein sorting-associated protein 41 homolog n=1 Tax=Lineus longissimus TaxID=88925 RepID=UPI002B4C62B7
MQLARSISQLVNGYYCTCARHGSTTSQNNMADQEADSSNAKAENTSEEESDSEEEEKDDEGSAETSEEDDSEEEGEPKLKYERIGNDLMNIMTKDCASCMAVHPKFLALGTHWGHIHIMDHMGYNIRDKELAVHTTTVNQIAIDDNGDNMATCSDDGRVVITGLYSSENNQTTNFDRPVKAVAIDPQFHRSGTGRQFATGDDRLLMYEKGFLSRKSTVIHSGEGPIRNIKWKGAFVAWCNDLGVKIYDTSTKKRITNIPRDHNKKLRPELYRCSLCWKDDTTLLIGWGDTIKMCSIKNRVSQDARDLPSRYVEITSMLQMDFYVCGLAPFGENIIILSYSEDGAVSESGEFRANRPHLTIIEPHFNDYTDVSNDALSIRGFELYKCNDYHLESLIEENLYYIVSPKDVVVAKLRDIDDHIQYLLEHFLFEEAMLAANEHSKELKRHDPQEIGRQYLNHLIENVKFDDAARLCIKVLGKNKQFWEEEVYKFARIQQLKAIAPYLPKGDPKLEPAVYEMVLNEFLQINEEGFKKYIHEWPCDLYNIQTLVRAVKDKLSRSLNQNTLLVCLAQLYTYDTRFDQALAIYLQLKHDNVFDLIHRHNLFYSISDKIVMLMGHDEKKAVKLLLDNMDKVPMEKVVKQLENHKRLLHVYLDALFKKDPDIGQEYHGLQVALYADHDPANLIKFLRSSNYYPLQHAMEECQKRRLTKEMVYLLEKMGNRKQALRLINQDLRDVNQAIEFCKTHDDRELWQDLIDFSMDKPSFITSLLRNIGTHVDPIILIKKINEGLEIPGLRDSLVKILQDYNLQIALREGCKKILVSDCFGLLTRLVKTQKKGTCIESMQLCHECHGRIIVNDLRLASNVSVFYCKHAFHEECLPTHSTEVCPICNSQRRGPGTSRAGRT